jgi:hypothetical protein
MKDVTVADHHSRGQGNSLESLRVFEAQAGLSRPWPKKRQSCFFKSSGDRGRPRFLRYAGVATVLVDGAALRREMADSLAAKPESKKLRRR